MTTRSKARRVSVPETGASPDDSREEDLGGSTRSSPPPSLAITEQQLTALIRGITGGNASVTPPPPPPSRQGTFAKCSARFAGSLPRDPDVLEAFIDAVEVYKDCACVSDEHALRGLPMLLTGEAAVWWQGVKQTTTTWSAAIERLRGMFGAPRPPYKIFKDVFAAEQRENERADVFIARVRSSLAKLPYNLEERVQIDMTYGLLHKRVRKRLQHEECVSMEGFLRRAREIEECIEDLKVSSPSDKNNSLDKNNCSDKSSFSDKNNESSRSNVSVTDKPPAKSRQARPRCGFCHLFGHNTSDCRRLADRDKGNPKSEPNLSTKSENSAKNELRCYGCGQLGVVRSKCSVCRSTPSATKADDKRVDFHSVSGEDLSTPRRPTVRVSAAGRTGVAVLDTGATHSIASPALHQILLDSGVQFIESQRPIGLADGTCRVSTILTCDTEIGLEGRDLPVTFMVLPDAANARTLLGLDFITRAGIVVDAPQEVWYFADSPSPKYDFVTYHLPSSNDEILALNDTQPVCLRDDEGTKLSSEQRARLDQLLSRYADVFATEGPPTEYAMHCIKVKEGQQPIASPPYRMSAGKKEILEKELRKLLEADIIEECDSPWAANVVLVGKKDGGVRLCVDYRKLNSVTEPDRYPLPRMEDILHEAKSSKFMTTLDLRSGYFQALVRPEDRDKTAFVTPLGTYRFKRMPMGLRNSGATFQRLMDRFKSNLKDIHIWAYLDDLCLLSDSYEKHLEDLEAVFQRLRMFKLRVHRQKSNFARDSIRFLGHVIVPGGLSVDSEKIAAIAAMTPPQNLKHLKSFIQTASWFRRFIPNFAATAKPLTDLLKKDSSWKWDQPQQDAFDQLKVKLTSAPILRQAEGTKPYALYTDSSGYALGAVLMQGEGPDERPIEYASRLLTSAERNYTTTEREALAVVWAVQKFRGYIEGATVRVMTDHQPLKWLMNLKSPSGRLARWALSLQEYNLEISYMPGKRNIIADTLSRPSCSNDNACDFCFTSIDMPTRSPKDIRDNQMKDSDVKKIIDDMESDDPFKARIWSDRGYVMSDGILHRCSADDEDVEQPCLVVPRHEYAQILAELHDAPTAGHFGVERTLARLRTRYYWPGMRAYVADYIKRCVPCQRYKVDTRKPAGLVQTPATARRFEVISIDLFGPLPETTEGNRWIFIIEDVCSRWVELFALKSATSSECAKILINDIFFRYGVARRIQSDNGVQFTSDVMQQACHVMGVTQALSPLYHPESNPIERKNRDLKPQLAILVGQDHTSWDTHLAAIRFAMNSAVTTSTGFSPAFLTFGRELRAPVDATTDVRSILEEDNFVPSFTPYLRKMANVLAHARDVHEHAQAESKRNADEGRRPAPLYKEGQLILLKTHGANDAARGQTPKLLPRRDGPYRIRQVCGPATYLLERVSDQQTIGKYHVSHLTPFVGHIQAPIQEKRRRGRPRKSGASPRGDVVPPGL